MGQTRLCVYPHPHPPCGYFSKVIRSYCLWPKFRNPKRIFCCPVFWTALGRLIQVFVSYSLGVCPIALVWCGLNPSRKMFWAALQWARPGQALSIFHSHLHPHPPIYAFWVMALLALTLWQMAGILHNQVFKWHVIAHVRIWCPLFYLNIMAHKFICIVEILVLLASNNIQV